MDKLYDTLFFLPENPNQHPGLLGVQSYFVESVGAAVTKNIGASETDISQKVMKRYFAKEELFIILIFVIKRMT